jgi:hypothetical protein
MSDYDLSRLSTGSFESLVQALAVKVLGAGTMIFGAGADGGREATYDGRVNYPSDAEPWNGYIVAQAKFRQRLTGKETDADWAIQQLRAELDKYAERKSGRRLPDYYIFATNVVLSPVQTVGGKDRLQAVFEEYKTSVPLRGRAIWDYDQIGTFLDAHESVRHAFTAFITSGDVLAAVMRRLHATRPDFEEVMTAYLARELNAAKFAGLDQTSTKQILLSRVFVDLPLAPQRLADPPDEEKQPLPGVVATLIDAARERLDPATLRQLDDETRKERHARFVLIGGPGQGKTTIGQFACQLFRAAILNGRRDRLPHDFLEPLDEIVAISERERLELPQARRFPLHVVLRDFAAELSRRKDELTLFTYLVERIRKTTSRSVEADDFRAWLGAYPWLVVLDGLDEVPSSSNRAAVLRAIEEFWLDAAQANADLLMVATTRPQDYQDDFSPAYYAHRWLVALSRERALKYGARLVETRFGGGSDRAQELIGRLETAAESEATARLMRTPLQVTIMATLVEQVGRPPQDKWRLFREYYGAIYRRERERSTSDLLGLHQSDIDAIHYRTGLELQILSGSEGTTDARLAAEQFTKIVRERLEEQGHEGKELERLVAAIVEAAATRLVFLVGLDVDSVGFEIRSLQEFMAAEALMDGPTELVQRRLRAIAGIASWRNVFIFAAGHCFAETESLIDTIHAICHELNCESDAVSREVKAGSRLALDLLEDAAVSPKPKHARMLARTALELAELPPDVVHERLGAVHTVQLDSVFREVLAEALAQRSWTEALGAWRVLGGLMERDAPWACELVKKHWPEEPEVRLQTADAFNWLSEPWMRESASDAVLRMPLQSKTLRLLATLLREDERLSRPATAPDELEARWQDDASFALTLKSIEGFEERRPSARNLTGHHRSWQPLLLSWTVDKLDARSLASILDSAAAAGVQDWTPVTWKLPWPVAAMLLDSSPESLRERAYGLRNGQFGDRTEWLAAEQRWKDRGFRWSELQNMQQPWPRDIADRGLPYTVTGKSIRHSDRMLDIAVHLAACFDDASDDALRTLAADALLFLVEVRASPVVANAVGLDRLMRALKTTEERVSPFIVACVGDKEDDIYTAFVELVGSRELLFDAPRALPRLIGTLARHPDHGDIAAVVRASVMSRVSSFDRSSLPVLPLDMFFSRHHRQAGTAINAISGKHTDTDVLARMIASEFPTEVSRIVARIEPPYNDRDEALLLALSRAVSHRDVDARSAIIEALDRVRNSKPGPGRDLPLWHQLGLTAG